jgi:hypothetical protein
LAIVAGALCAVASAWFVFPIRTEAVIRRRLADTLLALDELVVAAHGSSADHAGRLAHFDARLTELEGVAPPVEWHRRLFRRAGANEHPAGWIDRTRALRQHVRSLAAGDEPQRRRIRRAIGASRKAIAAHGKSEATPGMLPISAALDQLHETLAATSASNT